MELFPSWEFYGADSPLPWLISVKYKPHVYRFKNKSICDKFAISSNDLLTVFYYYTNKKTQLLISQRSCLMKNLCLGDGNDKL